MATNFLINTAALAGILRSQGLLGEVKRIAEEILADSTDNIESMGAVDTGKMKANGSVWEIEDGYRVGYNLVYAPIVHEGRGIGRNSTPRPFLLNAAMRQRKTDSNEIVDAVAAVPYGQGTMNR